jgi:hypothetical protein
MFSVSMYTEFCQNVIWFKMCMFGWTDTNIVLYGGFNFMAPVMALSDVYVVMNEVRTNGYLL